MSRFQAIIFDLDDTLYLEQEYVFSGFRAVAGWVQTRLGIPKEQGYQDLVTLYKSGVRGDTFNRWLEAHNLGAVEYVPQLVQVYRMHTPSLQPFAEVPALLTHLHRRYRLGLVSDGYLDVQRRKWDALEIARHFDVIVFSDELGRDAWKPSARPFEAVLEKLQTEASKAVYVADNPQKDFFGARQAGLNTIWCRQSQGDYISCEPPTLAHAADMTIEHLTDLNRALEIMEN